VLLGPLGVGGGGGGMSLIPAAQDGLGSTALGTLSGIGSDLSISVSFSIANELLAAAEDEQLTSDELIAIVLGFAIVLTAIQSRLGVYISERRFKLANEARSKWEDQAPVSGATEEETRLNVSLRNKLLESELEKKSKERGLLDFLYLLVSISQRIAVAICVQLLAASVRSNQESRFVRTLSLIALATFFVFLESLTNRNLF